MTPTIRILPEHLANKIAAGEVVQRPASAVKELLENSIDAGASSVTILIREGGTSSIRIIDDGRGMGPEDAVVAFGRHATSKISTEEDLERITTLGFRGEALASIAAVARVEMRTRREKDELATMIRIEGGTLLDSAPEAAPAGTSITVRNLFYNTPARRNFLKSGAAEYKQIYDVVQRVALSKPSLAVKFISDGETILDLGPSDLAGRVGAVFGPALAQTVFPFEETGEAVGMKGFLGRPGFTRKTRAEQYLFLNGRFIINRSVHHAVFKGYEHLLEKGSFPFFLLYLTIDPGTVDVNVHPSKLEVKFGDDGSIYRRVYAAVRRALSGQDLTPAAGFAPGSAEQPSAGGMVFLPASDRAGLRVSDWTELIRPEIPPMRPEEAKGPAPAGEPAAQGPAVPPAFSSAPLWQIHRKYIMTPVDEGVMVIDQHAAHERVLYERVIGRWDDSTPNVQQLLFPQSLELTPGDAALLGELIPLLEQMGFNVKLFGKTTAVLDGVPVEVKPGNEPTILREMIDLYKEDSHDVRLEPRERLAKSFSCKAAVKAGDPLEPAEMRSLLEQLFATKIPFVCPHGRPVMIRLSLADLDRRFGRTS